MAIRNHLQPSQLEIEIVNLLLSNITLNCSTGKHVGSMHIKFTSPEIITSELLKHVLHVHYATLSLYCDF